MFTLDNQRIGEYLSGLFKKYKSRREFCRKYLAVKGDEINDENINNLSNRIKDIVKGKNSIQVYDLPIFTELLGVTCEQILSAGDCTVPVSDRVTNYSIASSKDEAEWEKYINRADKLILNNDEYYKTVLDYAIEFGNYGFIKYLMDNNYIWFDCMNDNEYFFNFGAGTSIKRSWMDGIDSELQHRLMHGDMLRSSLIMIAAGKSDLEMLKNLRARECTQLYYRSFYHRPECTYRDGCYTRSCMNIEVIKRIASSSEKVLDYFTDSFDIPSLADRKSVNTFMFPYISKLLDILIDKNSAFTETALKKTLEYNRETYNKLCELISLVKNDGYYSNGLWIKACKEGINFYENGDIVLFWVTYKTPDLEFHSDGLITNVPHVTKTPASSSLKHLVKELNDSYEMIKNLKEHLEEV